MTESKVAETKRILTELTERWPGVFNVKQPVPLAIGIDGELLAAMPEITNAQLRRVLAQWCNRPCYLRALIAGGDRHGLEGVQGTVAEDAAKRATAQMEALTANVFEKAKAKRAAKKAEEARQAEATRKKAEKAAEQAKKAASAPPEAKPAAATPKTTGGPVIVVKKKRTLPLA